jgi:hypothetical protein
MKMSNNEYFGIVRWCNDDIASKLADMGIETSEEKIAAVRKNCENNKFFRDTMIQAGWDMIEEAIREELSA